MNELNRCLERFAYIVHLFHDHFVVRLYGGLRIIPSQANVSAQKQWETIGSQQLKTRISPNQVGT